MFRNILEKPITFYFILLTILTIVFEIMENPKITVLVWLRFLENAFVQI